MTDATEGQDCEQALREALRRRSVFLATMSHELRTPLNAIIGFSEFLIEEKAGALNEKQKEYLTDVLNSGLQLLQLINDVVDLSKVEAGDVEVRKAKFPIREVMDEVCTGVASMAAARKATVRREIAATLEEQVTLDRQKLVQVLYNLAAHAVRFTDEGGDVLIGARRQNAGLLVSVRYAGVGLLDGVGLALAKKLVEVQGGSISVESERGRGNTFTVLLPIAKGDCPSPA